MFENWSHRRECSVSGMHIVKTTLTLRSKVAPDDFGSYGAGDDPFNFGIVRGQFRFKKIVHRRYIWIDFQREVPQKGKEIEPTTFFFVRK